MRWYLIDLVDKRDGEPANWQLIAETAFKVGLDAIDQAAQSQRRGETLNRLHEAAYDRLADNISSHPAGGRTFEAPVDPFSRDVDFTGQPLIPETWR